MTSLIIHKLLGRPSFIAWKAKPWQISSSREKGNSTTQHNIRQDISVDINTSGCATTTQILYLEGDIFAHPCKQIKFHPSTQCHVAARIRCGHRRPRCWPNNSTMSSGYCLSRTSYCCCRGKEHHCSSLVSFPRKNTKMYFSLHSLSRLLWNKIDAGTVIWHFLVDLRAIISYWCMLCLDQILQVPCMAWLDYSSVCFLYCWRDKCNNATRPWYRTMCRIAHSGWRKAALLVVQV